jgi:hypothetical protein
LNFAAFLIVWPRGTPILRLAKQGDLQHHAPTPSSWHFFPNLYPDQYNQSMKPVRFLGDSLERIREFPEDARHDAGYQLEQVQRGDQPDDFKSMPQIAKGVEGIRLRTTPASTGSSTPHDWPMLSMCYTLFKRRPRQQRNAILTWYDSGSNKSGGRNEKIQNVHQRMGRDRGHQGTGGQFARPRGTDAKDRRYRKKAPLDAGGSR